MQQLTITLIALLGLFVPTANSRIAKFFARFVPPMSSGKVADEAAVAAETGTLSGRPQGCPALGRQMSPLRAMVSDALMSYMKKGEQHTKRGKPDSLEHRVQRAQRAAPWRLPDKPVPVRGDFFHLGFYMQGTTRAQAAYSKGLSTRAIEGVASAAVRQRVAYS